MNSILEDHIDVDSRYIELVAGAKEREANGSFSFEDELNVLGVDAPEVLDPRRWSKSQLAQRMSRTNKQVEAILSSPVAHAGRTIGGKANLTIEDLIQMSWVLRVPPSHLLRPTREHLTNNEMLHFVELGNNGLTVSALDWYTWVSGFATLPGMTFDEEALARYSRSLPDNNANLGREPMGSEINMEHEIAYDFGKFLREHEHRLPGMKTWDLPPGSFDTNLSANPEYSAQLRARSITLVQGQIRKAFDLLGDPERASTRQEDLDFILQRISEALETFALTTPNEAS